MNNFQTGKNIKKYISLPLILTSAMSLTGCKMDNADYKIEGLIKGLEESKIETPVDENIIDVLNDEELYEYFNSLKIEQSSSTINDVDKSFISNYKKEDYDKCNDALYIMNYTFIKSLILENLSIDNSQVINFEIKKIGRDQYIGDDKDNYIIDITYLDNNYEVKSYSYTTGDDKMRSILVDTKQASSSKLHDYEMKYVYNNVKRLLSSKTVCTNGITKVDRKSYDGSIYLEQDDNKTDSINYYLSNNKKYKVKQLIK